MYVCVCDGDSDSGWGMGDRDGDRGRGGEGWDRNIFSMYTGEIDVVISDLYVIYIDMYEYEWSR